MFHHVKKIELMKVDMGLSKLIFNLHQLFYKQAHKRAFAKVGISATSAKVEEF
jgi:hypothetical protein